MTREKPQKRKWIHTKNKTIRTANLSVKQALSYGYVPYEEPEEPKKIVKDDAKVEDSQVEDKTENNELEEKPAPKRRGRKPKTNSDK